MAKKPAKNEIKGREVIGVRRAAEILNCSMARVRQMTRPGAASPALLWSAKIADQFLVVDLDQVEKLAKARQAARDAGLMTGRPGGRFSEN